MAANLQYGGAYRASLEEALRTGKCPFCEPKFRMSALFTHAGWFVVNVKEEYRQSDREGKKPPVQLLFAPLRHRSDMKLLRPADWAKINELLRRCKKKFGFSGGCFFSRHGDPVQCGRTVRHPHVHYYVPRMVSVSAGPGGIKLSPIPIDIPAG